MDLQDKRSYNIFLNIYVLKQNYAEIQSKKLYLSNVGKGSNFTTYYKVLSRWILKTIEILVQQNEVWNMKTTAATKLAIL